MSKEREAFETQRHGYRQGYQDAKAHYQPLLDAKDAEIERLKEAHIYTDNSKAAALLQVENTTLKALLEKAREGLDKAEMTLRKHHYWQSTNTMECKEYGFRYAEEYGDSSMCEETLGAINVIEKAMAAINAAIGEK